MKAKKLHFGPLKREKPFLTFLGTMKNADVAFYEGYDPTFILKKSVALFGLYNNPALFKECVASCEGQLDTTDRGFLEAIASEIHCTSFHQIEVFLALLLAEYQDRPDWVYLTTYGNSEMKAAARAITMGEFEKLTDGAHKTAEEFVKSAVFAGLNMTEPEQDEAFKNSVCDIAWLLTHCAQAFLDGSEYNAYKHGLRVVVGPFSWAVRPTNSTGSFTPVISMKHSMSYLEIEEQVNSYTGERITKELNPKYSFQIICLISAVLTIVHQARLLRLGKDIDTIECPVFDRDELLSCKPGGKFSFSF